MAIHFTFQVTEMKWLGKKSNNAATVRLKKNLGSTNEGVSSPPTCSFKRFWHVWLVFFVFKVF